jgi:curved DNA-binding protein CbpA
VKERIAAGSGRGENALGGATVIRVYNHYEILGVSPKAPREEIRVAFRRLVKRFHPDVLPGATGDRFKQIVEAWRVLGDARSRSAYDREISGEEGKAPYARRTYDPENPRRR